MKTSLAVAALVVVLVCGLYGQDRSDFYDAYASAENRYTDIGELPIGQTPWFGPVQLFNSSDEPLTIEGQHSLDLHLEIISVPDVIPPGQAGTIEVLYRPRQVGLLRPRLELSTSQGRQVLLLRAIVTAENAWEVLGYAWPLMPYTLADAEDFMVDAKTLKERIADNPIEPKRLVVDIRTPEQHQNARIPGSLQMALHDLLNRDDWRERDLFVVDEGSAQSSVLSGLLRLREAGFQVRWVRHGLRGWSAAGGELDGPGAVTGQWAGLYPREVANSLYREQLVIVNAAGADRQKPLEGVFPGRLVVPWRGFPDEFDRDQPLLVVANEDHAYLNIEPVLRDEGFTRVFYLHGGVERLLKNLRAWNEPASTRFKLVRLGARNPRGKDLPETIVDRDCIDCLRNSRR